jgi:hypothetical protein
MGMRISVKQINLFGPLQRPSIGGCPRAWGFAYLDKLKPEWLAPQLVEGIKFHAVCASLVEHGVMPRPGVLQPGVELTAEEVLPESHLGRMGRASLIHLPRRDPYGANNPAAWTVEHVGSFPWTTSKGVEATVDLRPDLCSAPLGEPTLNYLVDFKSTSNRRYALKTLLHDVQANLYAAGLMHHGATSVLARWIYVSKKDYSSWPVDAVFHLERTHEWLHENVDATIELIHTIREAGNMTALDLPGDIEVCGGVGRFCDHAERCLKGPVGALPPRLITLEEIVRFKEGK